jgi:hypothetical protein
MTSMVLAPASGPADTVVEAPPQIPDQSLTVDVPPSFLSGFRAEGAPEVEVVFGDSESYKQHIDRFFALDQAMDRARSSFSRGVQAAGKALAAQKRGPCPVAAVARPYYETRRDGETYRALGAELESEQQIIVQLDGMGESAALTPDYRWKAKQVVGRYRRAVVDLKEMRIAFMVQLGSELRHRGCRPAELVKLGGELAAAAGDPAQPDAAGETPTGPDGTTDPVVPATTITFYVDNRACPTAQAVYLDGSLLGEVPAEQRSAFQALAGHHALCLIAADSAASCGDPGTLRSGFLHDAWSIALHCAN